MSAGIVALLLLVAIQQHFKKWYGRSSEVVATDEVDPISQQWKTIMFTEAP